MTKVNKELYLDITAGGFVLYHRVWFSCPEDFEEFIYHENVTSLLFNDYINEPGEEAVILSSHAYDY